MSEPRDDDWGPEEAAAWRRLGAGPSPPDALEERLVEALRREGLLASRRPAWKRAAAAAAAAVALFVGGLLVGRQGQRVTPSADRPRYVLFLYDTPASRAADGAEADRIREYAAWAREQRAQGTLEAGQRLEDAAVTLGAPDPAADAGPGGYFILRAASLDQAVAVARSCPHLRHGGRLVVRPIDPGV
jgi:hypothetical protein